MAAHPIETVRRLTDLVGRRAAIHWLTVNGPPKGTLDARAAISAAQTARGALAIVVVWVIAAAQVIAVESVIAAEPGLVTGLAREE